MTSKHSSLLTSAPQPSFPWAIDLPPHWAFLDLREEHTSRSINCIFDDFYAPLGMPEEARPIVAQQLEQLAQYARRKNAILTLMRPCVLSNGIDGAVDITAQWHFGNSSSITTNPNDSADNEVHVGTLSNGASYRVVNKPEAGQPHSIAIISVPETPW